LSRFASIPFAAVGVAEQKARKMLLVDIPLAGAAGGKGMN